MCQLDDSIMPSGEASRSHLELAPHDIAEKAGDNIMTAPSTRIGCRFEKRRDL